MRRALGIRISLWLLSPLTGDIVTLEDIPLNAHRFFTSRHHPETPAGYTLDHAHTRGAPGSESNLFGGICY